MLESISSAYVTLEHANANTNANANASTNASANEFELVIQNLMFLMEKVESNSNWQFLKFQNAIFSLIDVDVSAT